MPNYDAYLNRAYERAQNNQYMAYAKQQLSQTAKPLNRLTVQTTGAMARGGMSGASQLQTAQSLQGNQYAELSRVSQDAQQKAIIDRDQRETRIAELELQKEIDDQKKQDKKDSVKSALLGAGGTALGAVAGSLVPGVGTALGAQVGAGLGTLAGGVAYESPEQIGAGIALTAGSIADVVTLPAKRTALKSFQKNINNLSIEDLMSLRGRLNIGDYEGVNEFFESYQPVTPYQQTPLPLGTGEGGTYA